MMHTSWPIRSLPWNCFPVENRFLLTQISVGKKYLVSMRDFCLIKKLIYHKLFSPKPFFFFLGGGVIQNPKIVQFVTALISTKTKHQS